MSSVNFFLGRMKRVLFSPMDASGLAVVRILFGLLIIYEAARYVNLSLLVFNFEPQIFYFKFRYFEWVKPISLGAMQWLFILYGASGLMIALGLFYRLSTLIAALSISYIFLLDAANYLNHFYLIIVFSFMMFFIPAHRSWSFYAWLKPQKSLSTVPGWAIWIIRMQLTIVYLYAAIAKMNVDWINGMPLFDWVGSQAGEDGIENFLGQSWAIYGLSYVGLIYDLLVAPMLLLKRTRAIAFCLTIAFHLMNFHLFNIGIFPWFMLATSTIFFEPSWPRDFLHFFFKNRFHPLVFKPFKESPLGYIRSIGIFAMTMHLVFQALFPLRHFLYPNYVGWSEEGHNFSWHMKLRDKEGDIAFRVVDPDSKKFQYIRPERYLSERQIIKMTARPAMIIQFAHFLRDRYTITGEKPAQVYVDSSVSINGRPRQKLIDPYVDIAAKSVSEFNNDWILPLKAPVWNAHDKKNRFGPANRTNL